MVSLHPSSYFYIILYFYLFFFNYASILIDFLVHYPLQTKKK